MLIGEDGFIPVVLEKLIICSWSLSEFAGAERHRRSGVFPSPTMNELHRIGHPAEGDRANSDNKAESDFEYPQSPTDLTKSNALRMVANLEEQPGGD
jgi:hypothetical protein